ncbi:hypothetical protein G6F24_014042 [Rhizopus arrhizus]|nr:hypothetical protein G6F24_014042 [Rhizopus arrhizus]
MCAWISAASMMGQGTDPHGDEGDRHVLAQAAHLAHVLLVVHRDDDRAGTQEQQGLEERMGHQVEHGGRIGRHAQRHGHVAQLRQRGVRDDARDVGLDDAQDAQEQCADGADHNDERQRHVRQFKQRRKARDHEEAGRHHGGGVDQRGARGRAFHRVRQPHVQRDLGRLAHGADEQADTRHRQQHPVRARQRHRGQLVGLGEHFAVVHRAGVREQQADAQHEAEVADAVDQERLHVGEDGRRAGVPETDQQVRDQAHRFPAEEQLQEVVAHHQHQHREGKQRDICTISDTKVTTTIIIAVSLSTMKPTWAEYWPTSKNV